jgi:hypothetical protein
MSIPFESHRSNISTTFNSREKDKALTQQDIDSFQLGGIFVPVLSTFIPTTSKTSTSPAFLIEANPITTTLTIAGFVHTLVIFRSTSSGAVSQSAHTILLVDFPRLCKQELNSMRILLSNLHDLALQTCNSALNQPSDLSVLSLARFELTTMLAEQRLDPAQVELEVRRGVGFLRNEAEQAFEVDDWNVADEKVDVGCGDGAVDAREEFCV